MNGTDRAGDKSIPLIHSVPALVFALTVSILGWYGLGPLMGAKFVAAVSPSGAGIACGVFAWAALNAAKPQDLQGWIAAGIAALLAALLTATGIVWGALVAIANAGIAGPNVEPDRITIFLGGLIPGVVVTIATAFLLGRRRAEEATRATTEQAGDAPE
jgi:peptidoglycan biosynthesis protein MviN/MurJ (putative lipid II flippase)